MKPVLLIAMLFIFSYSVSGQDDIGACMRSMATNKDSMDKAGKFFFEDWKECALDKKLPSFKLVTLHGDTINSKQTEGKVVVLNFWFIDCHPCIAEVPGLNKLAAE